MMRGSSAVPTRRRVTAAVSLGVMGALAAAWVAERRVVRRALEAAGAGEEAEQLVMPPDVVHHELRTDDGGTVHVVERGAGPAMVLLHGVLLSSDIWVHQLDDLASRHRVVAVDLRGHGRSVPGDAGFAAATSRLAADVRSVLEQLDVRDCLLVGHSMGGMVALQLLNDLPPEIRERRVAALALVSTSAGPFVRLPGWSVAGRRVGAVSGRAMRVAERVGAQMLPAADLRWWVARLGFGPEPAPAQVRFVEQLHRQAPEGTLGRLVPSLATFDLSAELATIDVPALVVVGSRDRISGPAHARRIAAGLPRAELVELPRCGHMPMLERRHEFSHLLEEFQAKAHAR